MISILQVWDAIGGPEPKYNRARAFYRNGRNPGSVRFYPETNSFYDFGIGIGGHTVTLVALALSIPYENARQWLNERFGGCAMQVQELDPEELSRANGWKLAMLTWLEAQLVNLKRELAEELAGGKVDRSVANDIRKATEYETELKSLSRYSLVLEYRRQCEQHPDQVRELLAWAEETEDAVSASA